MKVIDVDPASVDSTFWTLFERRLAELPVTATDVAARDALLAEARDQMPSPPADSSVAAEYAELAHSLRYRLGPTVSEETLERAYDVLEREARALLNAGVSAELVGLVRGGGGVG